MTDPEQPGPTSRRTATLLLLLLLPLLVLIVLYRRELLPVRERPPEAGRVQPTAVERVEPPSIRSGADPSAPPYSGLKEPRGGDVDSLGRLWVADLGNSRLRIFDGHGGYLGGWGGKGDSTYAFRELSAVAIRGEDIYITDTWNGRVQLFALDGRWQAKASGLSGPRGVAVAPDGTVWVSDTGAHRVIAYDARLDNGRPVGKKGSGPGDFSSPVGIAVGPSGTVYVADTDNLRVVLLEPDGRFRAAWPIADWKHPVEASVEVDADESVYLTNAGPEESVLKLDGQGRIAGRRTNDDEGRRFSLPCGLALDRKNRQLYVVNKGTSTISKMPLQAWTAP